MVSAVNERTELLLDGRDSGNKSLELRRRDGDACNADCGDPADFVGDSTGSD
jgi:hypothetical protein